MIIRTPVVSSNVVSVGWEKETLEVEFKAAVYQYHHVPQSIFQELRASNSKGQFINQHIKGNYAFERV